MTDPRLLRLRAELYAAAQTLTGEDATAFLSLLAEVLDATRALRGETQVIHEVRTDGSWP